MPYIQKEVKEQVRDAMGVFGIALVGITLVAALVGGAAAFVWLIAWPAVAEVATEIWFDAKEELSNPLVGAVVGVLAASLATYYVVPNLIAMRLKPRHYVVEYDAVNVEEGGVVAHKTVMVEAKSEDEAWTKAIDVAKKAMDQPAKVAIEIQSLQRIKGHRVGQ